MDLSAILQPIIAFLMGYANQWPIIATILMVMGVSRIIFKSLNTFMRAVVDATPSPSDNLLLDQVEKSAIYKGIEFVLDLFLSIKLKK